MIAEGLEGRTDDALFDQLADFVLAHPEKSTSAFALAFDPRDDEAAVKRYLSLDGVAPV